ncbi:hypothetical protein VCR4J5_710015 [Vibrio crassostreae]|uniref:Uncharacterized protein n=1 Tax=Vibrio crassostreae TaxID=246167 RepID=A0A822MT98_9VIBR|nr:hypothetical protein VCR5J5_1160047 [Vibrio crassostreae]CDT03261.1 hypothetical protein VCR15J5_20094 [Vibrio crassostreae]CDT16007.1 hypothetical protein VCR19J5_1290041 [Vibrio crassostreae]CDT55952.1 hypothetical protein VCR4J5_710015 [Vibrio crassostreae]
MDKAADYEQSGATSGNTRFTSARVQHPPYRQGLGDLKEYRAYLSPR